MLIRTRAYARAGLAGNPSDGYFGKTIAFTFGNFFAEVILHESPELEIMPNTRDRSEFQSIEALVSDVQLFGYYGGIRLLKAATKKFWVYCREHDEHLHDVNFTLRYRSNIPHMVGLAGSSAIITASMRALMEFYGVAIPREDLANLILAVERDELQISAGLQDRVVQVYEGIVYMDFDRSLMDTRGYGEYEHLDLPDFPPIYLAYHQDLAQLSAITHNDMRQRYERKDPEVLAAIDFWRELTDEMKKALVAGDAAQVSTLIDANFDRRRDVMPITEGCLRMIDTARRIGASAKFTGSGGAIVGTYSDEDMFARLRGEFAAMESQVIKPVIVMPAESENE